MVSKVAPVKVKLLKDEFAKFTSKNIIEQEGFEKIGKTLGVDIYNDVFFKFYFYKNKRCSLFTSVTAVNVKLSGT